jgi:hypothetical protein
MMGLRFWSERLDSLASLTRSNVRQLASLSWNTIITSFGPSITSNETYEKTTKTPSKKNKSHKKNRSILLGKAQQTWEHFLEFLPRRNHRLIWDSQKGDFLSVHEAAEGWLLCTNHVIVSSRNRRIHIFLINHHHTLTYLVTCIFQGWIVVRHGRCLIWAATFLIDQGLSAPCLEPDDCIVKLFLSHCGTNLSCLQVLDTWHRRHQFFFSPLWLYYTPVNLKVVNAPARVV